MLHTRIHMHVFISSCYIPVSTHSLPQDKTALFILKTAAWRNINLQNLKWRIVFELRLCDSPPSSLVFFILKQKVVILLLWHLPLSRLQAWLQHWQFKIKDTDSRKQGDCSYIVTWIVSLWCIDGPLPGHLYLLWLITGTFLLAQTCTFIIVITVRPHSHWGLIYIQDIQ